MTHAKGLLRLLSLLGVAGPAVLAMTANAEAETLYVANGGERSVTAIDVVTNKPLVKRIRVGSAPTSIKISPDGSRAYVASGSGTVSVINTATNQLAGKPVKVRG